MIAHISFDDVAVHLTSETDFPGAQMIWAPIVFGIIVHSSEQGNNTASGMNVSRQFLKLDNSSSPIKSKHTFSKRTPPE
jgi:hypothetical protein